MKKNSKKFNRIPMQLRNMRIGTKGRITGLNAGEAVYRQRLIAMGLIPGTEFVVSRIAPLGDPVEITVRGFALSLRKGEAGILKIEQVPE
jgi:ferrous iron transport protein A